MGTSCQNPLFYGIHSFLPGGCFKKGENTGNAIWDVLLPNDYDETWSYLAIEPSFNFYFTDNFYGAVSATMGSFIWFEPRADMIKAGLKVGYAFREIKEQGRLTTHASSTHFG